MDLPPLMLLGLMGLILIGGPIWLIGNALERRRARRAEAAIDHSERADSLFDSIGPLSHMEALGVIRLGLYSISTTGHITWEEMLSNVAIARRSTREWEAANLNEAGGADALDQNEPGDSPDETSEGEPALNANVSEPRHEKTLRKQT